ncbi:MAG: type II toxin-antitoxin system RelE/ParE family toxin [Alphaproteobacteria bacterium]|nr:type II toxin-antitoxin system RelE/ParE family toxin [Alphaproteobacteria bacterium]
MVALRLTRSAEEDLRRILADSLADYGATGLERYRTLIGVALGDLSADGAPPGSRDRPELGDGLRSYHLMLCRRRGAIDGQAVRRPRHVLVYRPGPEELVVLRILHDAMELSRHLPGWT